MRFVWKIHSPWTITLGTRKKVGKQWNVALSSKIIAVMVNLWQFAHIFLLLLFSIGPGVTENLAPKYLSDPNKWLSGFAQTQRQQVRIYVLYLSIVRHSWKILHFHKNKLCPLHLWDVTSFLCKQKIIVNLQCIEFTWWRAVNEMSTRDIS